VRASFLVYTINVPHGTNLRIMKRQKIKIELIETNEGQILGVPKNPRYIKGEEFEKLKKSIVDFPEMLTIREVVVFPLNGRFIALGGNMRFLACKDLGYKEIDCVILPADMPAEKLKEFAIKDNSDGWYGKYDWDKIANEWDTELLTGWGMKIPHFENVGADNFGEDFSLKSGDREKFQQMTFTFSDMQAEEIKAAISKIKETDLYKNYDSENENSNGNSLYLIVSQWVGQRK